MSVSTPARAPLRFDPRLPGRDHLLDDNRAAALFAATLGQHAPLPVQRVERQRVKYRIGESLRSVHRVWSDGRSWLVSARMRTAGATALYAQASAHERACGPVRGVSLNEAVQAVFWTFPNDRVLGDAAVLSPELPALAQAWPGVPLQTEVVGYNPERAVIARVADAGGNTRGFAKLYAQGTREPAQRALEWLAGALSETGAPLRVPRLLAFDSARHVLVVDTVHGQHLAAVGDASLPRAFHGLGTALAYVHALPLPDPASALPALVTFAGDELQRAADAVAWARPDLADRGRRAADLLERHRPRPSAPVGLHGDMNSRNWLAGATDVGLIDFDQAATGPAGGDLAGVLGWLRARTAAGVWRATRESELAGAFQAGYAAVRPLPSARDLSWFRGAALLVERAHRAVTRVRLDQLACLDALVDAAAADATETARA